MGRTEYRNVREEWDYEHLDARGNPRRIYVESSFDDSDDKKASVFNKHGIFWKDGHYQWKVVTNTGRGRTVYEDTYEEDVETRYAWLYVSDLASILQKGEIIHVPILSGKKKGSSIDVGYVCFNMKNDCGKSVKVWGIYYEGEFIYYDNNRDSLKGELIIPSNVRGLEVKSVRGFGGCVGITRLVLSEGIGSINEGTFVGCKNIQEIVFPKTIHRIYPGAFERCDAIKRLVIPEEVRHISYGLSWYHSFKHVIGNLEEIARFEGDTQEEHVLYLDNGSYLDFVCGKSINGHYTILDGTETIGTGAFASCKGLTCITIPASVKCISEKAFVCCSHLERVIIGDNSQLKTIGDSAFGWCESLYHIEMPSVKVAANAFQGCLSLEEVLILPQNEYPIDVTPYADTPFGRNLERIREMKKKEAEERLRQEIEKRETKKRWKQRIISGILLLVVVLVIINRVAIWDFMYAVYCSVARSMGW